MVIIHVYIYIYANSVIYDVISTSKFMTYNWKCTSK